MSGDHGKPPIVTVALSDHVFAQGDYVGPASHGRVMVRIFGRLVSGLPVGPLASLPGTVPPPAPREDA